MIALISHVRFCSRGIMMLTLPTAKSLGVKSRLNPYENIMAGAKHFSDLLKSFSDGKKS